MKKDRGPGVKVPPPLITGCVIAAGFLMHYLKPVFIHPSMPSWPGYLFIFLALTIVTFSVVPFFVFKTHIEPWKPTTSLIQSGIFKFSRNPIYLSFLIITVGIGLLFNSVWILFSTVILKTLLRHLVIAREETYLLEVFGSEYSQYCDKVRRWI